MDRPAPTSGLRHVALWVNDLEACEDFYVRILGMEVEWRPDEENVYLTSGVDNLALHQARTAIPSEAPEHLDHIGFIINDIEQVDEWYDYMKSEGVVIAKELKTHRDGARSYYCKDPDGNVVQMIYHPPLAKID
ncbi:MAG: VOC family protein [Gammaproteobacteria bacterium]|nr:MAG: VOC family protein [Gammaproteobacteria bacterium]